MANRTPMSTVIFFCWLTVPRKIRERILSFLTVAIGFVGWASWIFLYVRHFQWNACRESVCPTVFCASGRVLFLRIHKLAKSFQFSFFNHYKYAVVATWE